MRQQYEAVLRQENLEPVVLLTGILRVYVEYALSHPNHYRMWFESSRLRREDGSLKMAHGRLEYDVFQAWIDRIEACREAGMFPGRDTEALFQILWSRVHGRISLRLQHPEFHWLPVEEHLATVLDLPQGRS